MSRIVKEVFAFVITPQIAAAPRPSVSAWLVGGKPVFCQLMTDVKINFGSLGKLFDTARVLRKIRVKIK